MKNTIKRLRNAAACMLLAGCLSVNGIAGAFGETSPAGVEIKEFSLLDTASDMVGAADFTPEGNKDGHFKLQLNLEQKTVIQSIVLRSTDDYGKDNYQGVWRTNRVTTGWLLGIVQDKTEAAANGVTHQSEIINPGFRKDVKEPVGEFVGNLTFDLYASDNGTIKESQFYVLEIETPQGTIVSKPIKYLKPMTSGGASSPSTTPSPSTPVPAPSPEPIPSTPIPAPAPSPATPPPSTGPTFHVYYKGQELQFDSVQPVLKDGSTLVPFRKLFETLGFTVKWVDSGATKQAIGTKADLTIELTINSSSANVNGQEVPLDIPAQIVNGNTLVPLRFVAENSGYQVTYANTAGAITIQIESSDAVEHPAPEPEPVPAPQPAPQPNPEPQPTPEPDPVPVPEKEAAEPYVVKGYVRDATGHPIPGVSIYADNTLMYDSNILGVTDDQGHYRIELPQVTTTWRMGAEFSKSFNNQRYDFHLSPDVDQPLASSTGAVRDFTWNISYGKMYVYPNFYSFDDSLPEFNMTDLELTLTPVGRLIDGSTGQTMIKRCGPVSGGLGASDIPIGRYKVTARWLPEGHAPMAMQVKANYEGKYADSAQFDFKGAYGTDISYYLSELEVQLPLK